MSGIIGGTMACWNHPFEVARIEMQSRADQGQGKVRPIALGHTPSHGTAHTRHAPDSPCASAATRMCCVQSAAPRRPRTRAVGVSAGCAVESDGLIVMNMGLWAARHADEHGAGVLHGG
jgi:hypothetical protein